MAHRNLSGGSSHRGKLPKLFQPGYPSRLPLFQGSGHTSQISTLPGTESSQLNISGVSKDICQGSTSVTGTDSIGWLKDNIPSSLASEFCDQCFKDPKIDRSSCAKWDESFKLCGADFVDHLKAGRTKAAGTMKRRAGESLARKQEITRDRLAWSENPLEIPDELKKEFCVTCLQNSLFDSSRCMDRAGFGEKVCGLDFVKADESTKNKLIITLAALKKMDKGEDFNVPRSNPPAATCHHDKSSPLLFELDLEEFKPVKEPLTWESFEKALMNWAYGKAFEKKTAKVMCALLLMAIYGLKPRELFQIRWQDIQDKKYLFVGSQTKVKELTPLAELVLKSLGSARKTDAPYVISLVPDDKDDDRVFDFTTRSLERYVKEVLPPDRQFEDGSLDSNEGEIDLNKRGPVVKYFNYNPRDVQALRSQIPPEATKSWFLVKSLPNALGEEKYNETAGSFFYNTKKEHGDHDTRRGEKPHWRRGR